ncbi:hypothetical protein OEZ49_02940 [Ruegeria sp. WL0004]|uniref:Protein NO VEIN C-terminal domain-containing protein n=1 Tax=Ruegeria marisflavi TaxID=2984152 RepID=A0ABT2WLM3_9RHOB|nr:hypothetical protein [Ruegeria sp. WL0004]MCU9836716.1 hypothetical protein [Ruegeria sp. WL0004]
MNNGSGPVSIRELWVGHGKIEGQLSPARYGLTIWNFLHPRLLEPEAMNMDFGSAYGKDGYIIKIDPGSARKWEIEIKSLQEAYKERILFSKDFNKKYTHDDAKYRFALRIRHTRWKHPTVLALEPRNTELLPGNQTYLPNFTYCDENIEQDF